MNEDFVDNIFSVPYNGYIIIINKIKIAYDFLKEIINTKNQEIKNKLILELEKKVGYEIKFKNSLKSKVQIVGFKKDEKKHYSITIFEKEIKIEKINCSRKIYNFEQYSDFCSGYQLIDKNKKIVTKETLIEYIGEILYTNILLPNYYEIDFYKNDLLVLGDLTPCSDLLLSDNSQEVFITKERNDFVEQIEDFSKENPKFICGNRGIGKTVSLLYFRYIKGRDFMNNIFYFNCKYLFHKYSNCSDILEYLKKELFMGFRDYDKLNSFTNKYLLIDEKTTTYSLLKKTINGIMSECKAKIIYIILDQYKTKYESSIYKISKELISLSKRKELCYIECSSINEKDIRLCLEDQLIDEVGNKKCYTYYTDLVCVKHKFKENFKSQLFSYFGSLPLFYNDILNIKDDEDKKIYLKRQSDEHIKKLENILSREISISEKLLFNLLIVYDNIGQYLIKDEIKKIFPSIPLKFISIKKTKDKKRYILEYSYPFLKEVFINCIKKHKKTNYYNYLYDANDSEKGYILERLVFFNFDKGEKPFNDINEVKESYEVDQIKYISKIYLNFSQLNASAKDYTFLETEEEERVIYIKVSNNLSEENIIQNLIEDKKFYNFTQKNAYGPTYDGALLIPTKNERSFELMLYQITKKRRKNKYLTRNIILKDKINIVNLFEKIFNIQIEEFSFIYILLNEIKDEQLIEYCNKQNIKLGYIFYSFKNGKLSIIKNKINVCDFNHDDIDNKNIFKLSDLNNLVYNWNFCPSLFQEKKFQFYSKCSNYIEKDTFLIRKRKKDNSNEDDEEKKFIIPYTGFLEINGSNHKIIPQNINNSDSINQYFSQKEKKKKEYDKKLDEIKIDEKLENEIVEKEFKLEKKTNNEKLDILQKTFSEDEKKIIKKFFKNENNPSIDLREFMILPNSIPRYPLFLLLYDKERRMKYIISYLDKKILKYNITENKDLSDELFLKMIIECGTDTNNFIKLYSTYCCSFRKDF